MLRTDKPIYKVILAVNFLLIVIGLVINIRYITNIPDFTTVKLLYRIANIIALVSAAFYILLGYRKNAAIYFKLYGLLYLLSQVAVVISAISMATTAITYIICIAAIVITLILVACKDLGKEKSLCLCGLLVLVQFIACIVVYTSYGSLMIVMITRAVDLVLACLYGFLTYAKYLDKTERGTK